MPSSVATPAPNLPANSASSAIPVSKPEQTPPTTSASAPPVSDPAAPEPTLPAETSAPEPVTPEMPTLGPEPAPTPAATQLDPFSFFVTSMAALQDLSGSQDGFGGDLRYGEADGLSGADKLCTEIAERSMPGSGVKVWHAFLSVTEGGPDGGPIHAKDRIGQGPWYDRLGRVVALDLESLLQQRPEGADPEILNDLPNEDGVPNHSPEGELLDNHDMLTGTDDKGELYTTGGDALASTCNNWTSAEPSGAPRVGHPWPTGTGGDVVPVMGGGFGGGSFAGGAGSMGGGFGGGAMMGFDVANWMSALDETGCAPGGVLEQVGPPMADDPRVGSGGGYGGFYCFALTP
jgi:hypothetical protein